MRKLFSTVLFVTVLVFVSSDVFGFSERQSSVLGRGKSARSTPYLFNEYSKKNREKSRSSFSYNVLYNGKTIPDSLHIIALRVEFQPDSSSNTTGNGFFGIYRDGVGNIEDVEEWDYYNSGIYKYDNLPHDSLYFAEHLEFAKNYFDRVSDGNFSISYEIFPKGSQESDAYRVPKKMAIYSPGSKKSGETWDEYYERRTKSLLAFIRDAVKSADESSDSPFRNIIADTSNGKNIFYKINDDSTRIRAAFLIFHAGASYLTDGGLNGNFGKDTPSDMIDAFISSDFFSYFASDTSMHIDSSNNDFGILVNKAASNKLLVDELMMVSETSNQDSLNWGINGIIVNQIARQIGLPDLFSTMSGISGIGGFGVMDFAGYSASNGFIPPWPSAWTRAYAGWDRPKVLTGGTANIKALNTKSNSNDTTIILIPLNSHEYYLVENRQRNLTGTTSPYNFDTTSNKDTLYVSSYAHVNLDSNVTETFSHSNVIKSVRNFDIGIPASGVLIWHVDDYIIADHIDQNVVNSDSAYRGVSLLEADGMTDLGVQFTDMFYQAAFDYGGAADVFPNLVLDTFARDTVNEITPFSRPSTKCNDGGHSYISVAVRASGKTPETNNVELMKTSGKYTLNFVDTLFSVTVAKDSTVTKADNWPQRLIPGKFLAPLNTNIYQATPSEEIAVIDTEGRLYIFETSMDKLLTATAGEPLPVILYSGDTLYGDTVFYSAKLPKPVSFPTTTTGTNMLIPVSDGNIYIVNTADSISLSMDTVPSGAIPSSYITAYSFNKWVLGLNNGTIIFGEGKSVISTVKASNNSIFSLAVVDTSGIIAATDSTGNIYVLTQSKVIATAGIESSIPPLTVTCADLNNEIGSVDIVLTDMKQGLWAYKFNISDAKLSLGKYWSSKPNDWAGYFRTDTARTAIPDNGSAPAIADIDGDGFSDIILGGTNGIYVYNREGVLLPDWPMVQNWEYWLQRGSVVATPCVAFDSVGNEPIIIYPSSTGDNITYAVAKIDSSDTANGTIYYTLHDGKSDSISGLRNSLIDSLLVFGDSLVLPYVAPGGFVDAIKPNAKRPAKKVFLSNTGYENQSNWPISIGTPALISPIISDLDKNNKLDIITVSNSGWLYRNELSKSVLSTNVIWAQTGFNPQRTFASFKKLTSESVDTKEVAYFYSHPNPVKAKSRTTFKYQLGSDATSVRLDIFTMTGHHVYKSSSLPVQKGWNETSVDISLLGSAVYRCRLAVDFGGSNIVKYWKMAVIK